MHRLIILLGLFVSSTSLAQTNSPFILMGIDYRQYPIDIENAPRGPYNSNGGFYGDKFWKTPSLLLGTGLSFKKNLALSLTTFTRYNHLYWLDGQNFASQNVKKRAERKNIKLDMFIDIDKSFRVKKSKNNFLFASLGIGVLNLNTKYNVVIQDTFPNGLGIARHYKGSLTKLAPRISTGYRFKNFKIFIEAFITENPDLTNLISLWLGGGLKYDLFLKNRVK